MKLFKFKEQTGTRVALSVTQNPDLPSGAWEYVGPKHISRGDGRLIGADADEIIDGVERDGIFVWPAGEP